MKSFTITFKNELIRMVHRKRIFAGLLVAAGIPILIVLAKVLALGWNITLLYREDLFRLALSFYTPFILPLFAIILIADTFNDEQSKGSLKTSILLPDSRSGHFMAKMAGSFSGVSGMVLSLWFFSIVMGLLLPSRGAWFLSICMGFIQSLASLLPIIMVLGFAVLASQFTRSGSGMVLLLILLSLVMRLIPLWIGDLNRLLPTSWLGFGSNISSLPLSSSFYAVAVMLLWSIFTSGLALFHFERKII